MLPGDMLTSARQALKKSYLRIAALYVFFGFLWILFSDALLAFFLGSDALQFSLISAGKGIFFVLATGAMLYWLVRREYKREQTAAERLQDSEEAYRYLFLHNPRPMWIDDMQTMRFVEVNDAALMKYGYTREEFLSMSLLDIRPEEDHERLRESMRAARPVYDQSSNWRHKLKDGRLIDVEIDSYQMEWMGRPSALVIAHDVTERNATQQALIESELRLNRILDNMQEAVWVADIERQRIVYANPVARDLMGLSDLANEDALTVLDRALHPEDREQVFQATVEMITVRTPNTVQTFRVIGPDGEVHWVRQSLNLIEEGGTLLLEGIASDISDRVQAEQEHEERERLRALLDKEAEIRAQRQRFLSMVSHEFRTPITVISSSLEMIQRYGERMEPAQHAKHLERALSNVRRTNDLLTDMLMLSRTEAVAINKEFQVLDAEAICAETVHEMRVGLAENLTLIYEPGVRPAMVMSDVKILRQIVTNLLGNAIKYSPEGGTVTLRLSLESDYLCICVQDQGIGIPQEAIPTLFEPFTRAENARQISGTGLGLAIVKMCVDQHGGRIAVESEEGRGTTFRVYLPIAQAASESAETALSGGSR